MYMSCTEIADAIIARQIKQDVRGQTPSNTISNLLHRESRQPPSKAKVRALIFDKPSTSNSTVQRVTRFQITAVGKRRLAKKH